MLDCSLMFNVKVLTFCDGHRHSVCLSPYIRKFCNQIFHVVVMGILDFTYRVSQKKLGSQKF